MMHNCTCCFWLQCNVSVIVAWSSLGCHFDLLQKVIPCTSVPQKDDLLANLPHMACLCIARADASMMYIFPNLREFVPIHHLIQVSLLKKGSIPISCTCRPMLQSWHTLANRSCLHGLHMHGQLSGQMHWWSFPYKSCVVFLIHHL